MTVMYEEWYPRECQFCDYGTALACTDPICRKVGFGEDHKHGCDTIKTHQFEDCTCISDETRAELARIDAGAKGGDW